MASKLLFIVGLLYLFTIDCIAQNEKDDYKYPVISKEDWQQYFNDNVDKRIEIYQVPDSILKNMSDEGLIETCLNYPYNNFILFASDSRQETFEHIMHNSNANQELIKRKGISQIMLKIYREINFKDVSDKLEHSKEFKIGSQEQDDAFDSYCMINHIGFLMAQPFIIDSLREIEKKELIIDGLRNLENLTQVKNSFDNLTFECIAYPIAKIIVHYYKNDSIKNITDFTLNGQFRNEKTLSEIIKYAKSLNTK